MTEKNELKRDGAKATKNSGRGKIQKGDARLGPFTIDYKEAQKSFTLNDRVWAKVALDAWKNGATLPALKVILGTDVKERLFIIQEDVFHDYIRLLELEENGTLSGDVQS